MGAAAVSLTFGAMLSYGFGSTGRVLWRGERPSFHHPLAYRERAHGPLVGFLRLTGQGT